MKPIWTMVPRGDVSVSAAGIYVSMNREGAISLNLTAYKRLGKPSAVHLLFDRVNNRIALKPTIAAMRNAYPIGKRKRGHLIYAKRLPVEFGIEVPEISNSNTPRSTPTANSSSTSAPPASPAGHIRNAGKGHLNGLPTRSLKPGPVRTLKRPFGA